MPPDETDEKFRQQVIGLDWAAVEKTPHTHVFTSHTVVIVYSGELVIPHFASHMGSRASTADMLRPYGALCRR
jgi:hypothetical protein